MARILPGRTLNRPCAFCQFLFPAMRMQCPSCLKNNPDVAPTSKGNDGKFNCKLLSEYSSIPQDRIATGFCDKVFGGKKLPTGKGAPFAWGPGMVRTSVSLIGGAPGAGKSTLALQLLNEICKNLGKEGLYIGVEETEEEINDRAVRLNLSHRHLMRLYGIGNDADIGAVIMFFAPCAMVLDSIPGLTGEDLQAGVDMCKTLKLFCAKLKAPALVIDQVTKADSFAGLRKLEHTVDWTGTFFAVEDDSRPKEDWVRELTVLKNRNGRAHIISEYEMTPTGLEPIPEYDEDVRPVASNTGVSDSEGGGVDEGSEEDGEDEEGEDGTDD